MNWDGNNNNLLRNFVSVTDHSSIGFLYDHNHHNNNNNHFPSNLAGEILMGDQGSHHEGHVGIMANYLQGNNDQKKKKMRSDQLELLENSFQEEIKLDPDRKLRLSRELGLQPRQIAIWFQNRRARWKAKQIERLYNSLKLEFNSVSREKLELQEEVLRLKAMVGGVEPTKKQPSGAGQNKTSGEETLVSARNSNEVVRHHMATDLMMNAAGSFHHPHHHHHHHHMVPESGYQLSNVQESYNVAAVMNSYWAGSEGAGGLPSIHSNSNNNNNNNNVMFIF